MRTFALAHLGDADLLRELAALVAQDHEVTARLLAHIAEVDARGLYLPAGYPSMHAYCVEELHFSESAAFKLIHAARTARQFPGLLAAVAEGRLHLTAVRLLAAYLTPENADELVRAATHRRGSEIEQWLARRFPREELLPEVVPAVAPIGGPSADPPVAADSPDQQAPGPVDAPRKPVAPVPANRFAVPFLIDPTPHANPR